jgi:hypothetical protein
MSAGLQSLIGRPLDGLTLAERLDHMGRWVALELYTPQTLPLRNIDAEGADARDCIRQLVARGLDPTRYEYILLRSPYQS